ncbi:MAG: XRE family transcriptional regulator [Erysipelotrichia bacterium]|nr:XRE family transcriptional regulator [Erysipelotrichia bacterium]NCC54928.1 XRE family transcriptional regulator [Erysipelotrichia bacterium]
MGEVIKMKFSDNLRMLRKQKGYSQEQLAEKLNVSRQAVSKWESESGFPEMDKLVLLSELFACSIDALLKEDLSNSTMMEKELYDTQRNQFSKFITFGIGIILAGICAYLALIIPFPENSANEYIGETAFMCFVCIGVALLIYAGMQLDSFHKKYPSFSKNLYTQTEIDLFDKKFRIAIVSGVTFILIGIILEIYLESAFNEDIANLCFMSCVNVGVSLFVYYGTQKQKFTYLQEQSKQLEPQKEQTQNLNSVVCGCIMLLTTIIFLLWSFLFNAWEISWIAFPVGAMLCGIATLIITAFKELKTQNRNE